MRADDFLTEDGLRSWLWKLGKDTFDYAAGQAPKVKNFIDQPKGGSFGGRVPASPDEATHVYRNMNPEELEAARKSGYFEKNPNPGKTDWDTDKKYWSQGDTEGYFGRSWKDSPDNAQVRLPQEKLPRWTAGKTGDAEVLDKTTGTWNPVKENAVDESKTVEFEGLTLQLQKESHQLRVKALDEWGNKVLGFVEFNIGDGKELDPQDLRVDDRYQGQGIARVMYDYVKSLGYTIVRSPDQTDAGAGFWNKHRPEQNVWEDAESSDRVIFIGNDTAIVGQEHGKRLQLSDSDAERVQDIAQRHGAWYEGNGMDRKLTAGIIDDYKGSWDDDLLSPAIKGYPAPFLYVLFSNIKENDTVEGKIGFDPNSTIFDRILNTQPSTNYFPDRQFDAETLQKFLKSVSEGPYDFVQMSQAPATESNVRKFFTQGEQLMFPDNWTEYPYRAGRVAKSVNDLRDKFLASRKRGVYVAGSDHLRAVQQFLDQNKQGVAENFADGKNPGRKGLAKRMGVNTKASVSDLRKTAKNSSGEKQRMAHWLANMKSGRNKNK